MFLEIERIGEKFGIPDAAIPSFIAAVAEVLSHHLRNEQVEDWHGKATRSSLTGQ